MSTSSAVRRRYGRVAVGVLLVALSGCATAPKREEPVRLVWPPPPLTARVEFVRSIVSDVDLGRDTTFSQKLFAFLAGDKPAPNRIIEPMGLAISDDGQRLYVSDFARLEVFVFDFGQKKFSKIGEAEKLARPVGLALDAQEQLYVVEQEKRGVSVFDRQGKRVRFFTHPSVERPTGIALDRERGKIYLADTAHTKSEKHTIKVFNMAGDLIGTIGGERGEGPGQFLFPTYLAVDDTGNLYVTDTLNSRVQVFDPDGKYVKTVGQRGSAWGMFDKPKGVALDSFGNVYVADGGWSNVQIFNPKGQVLLFFGGRGPIPGMLKNPTAIVIDKSNRIYVADYLNHRVEVYQLVNTRAEDSFLNPVAETKGGDSERPNGVAEKATQRNEKSAKGDDVK
ncbi:MAG: SMP-30/gluconolactonase/LRE family protein [Candidatus Rokubacteria bacterium]|nr:SMP-30/gluconolactonase/LRE family protein [Candidatus Rokubacteria bacterium]